MDFYQELGGKEGLDEIVDVFFARVLLDPLLMPWFKGIDVKRLHNHQVQFFASLFGWSTYEGADLRTAHRDLHITEEAFIRLTGHLRAALESRPSVIPVADEIMARVGAVKPSIVEGARP